MKNYENLLRDYIPVREVPCVFFGSNKRCSGNAHMAIIGSLGMALKSCDECDEYEPHAQETYELLKKIVSRGL